MSEDAMPDELRLPEELAACEARLAAQPLPASGIDRDRLMYQAGWAACEVRSLQPRPLAGCRLELATMSPPVQRDPRPEAGAAATGSRTVVWSFASAAVAASLAVAATLGWQSLASVEGEGAGVGTTRLATTVVEPLESATVDESASSVAPLVSNAAYIDVDELLARATRRGHTTVAGPFFAWQRDEPLTSDPSEAMAASSDAPAAAPKTARELWDELLPNQPARPASVWPWSTSRSGESI